MKGKKEKANETNRPKSPSHVLTARIYISIKIPSRPCETWDGRKRAKLERERERRLVARHRSHGGFGCNKVPWKSFVFLGTYSFNFDPGRAGTRYFPPPRRSASTPFSSPFFFFPSSFSSFFTLLGGILG